MRSWISVLFPEVYSLPQTMPSTIDPLMMIVPRRKITGISAILLPFTPAGEVDWPSFDAHVLRTSDAGLTPAVNMDTGYVNLLDDAIIVAPCIPSGVFPQHSKASADNETLEVRVREHVVGDRLGRPRTRWEWLQ